MVNESSTEVESETVASVDDEEEEGETGTVPDRSLAVDETALLDVNVVDAGQDALGAEGLGGADGGDDLLGEGSSFGDVLERHLHVLGEELVHDTTCDGDTGQNGGHGKGKTPRTDVGKDETSDEGAEEVDDHGDLLGRALLDEV